MQLNKKTKKNSFSSMALVIMLNINILTYGVFGIMQLAQLLKYILIYFSWPFIYHKIKRYSTTPTPCKFFWVTI